MATKKKTPVKTASTKKAAAPSKAAPKGKAAKAPSVSDVQRFIEHIDALAGTDRKVYEFSEEGDVPLYVMAYDDVPEKGYLTAVSFGLSLVPHKEWKKARPELLVSVKDKDHAWAKALGEVAYQLRGKCPFVFGDTVGLETPIAKSTKMSSFVAFAPIVLDRKDTVVPLSSYPVELRQLYPLYTGERVRIDSEGLDWFLEVDGLNPHDVKRKDFSAAVPAGKASKKPAPAAKAKPVAAAKAPAKPAKAPAKPAKAPAKPAKAPAKPAKAPAKPAKAPAKPAKTDKAKAAKKPAAKAKKKAR
jgi:hypothetical protein